MIGLAVKLEVAKNTKSVLRILWLFLTTLRWRGATNNRNDNKNAVKDNGRWIRSRPHVSLCEVDEQYSEVLPWTKKKNNPRNSRGERCSTCDIMLDDARSTQGKVFCDFYPALIVRHRAYHTWNSVLLAANLGDGSLFLSRVVGCQRKHVLSGQTRRLSLQAAFSSCTLLIVMGQNFT